MLEPPLDLHSVSGKLSTLLPVFGADKKLYWTFGPYASRTFGPYGSNTMREGVAATLFIEGDLPYQCVCCHLLHCFSGLCMPVSF